MYFGFFSVRVSKSDQNNFYIVTIQLFAISKFGPSKYNLQNIKQFNFNLHYNLDQIKVSLSLYIIDHIYTTHSIYIIDLITFLILLSKSFNKLNICSLSFSPGIHGYRIPIL